MEAHAKTQELLVDLLTMIGQSDIALWELRESVLYPKLSRDFVDMLKNLNKKKEEQVSSRFSTTRCFTRSWTRWSAGLGKPSLTEC